MISSINWQRTCCAWHGDYAEHRANDGGILRIKRGPSVVGYLVMHFDASGQCKTVDDNGVPEYETLTEEQLISLL